MRKSNPFKGKKFPTGNRTGMATKPPPKLTEACDEGPNKVDVGNVGSESSRVTLAREVERLQSIQKVQQAEVKSAKCALIGSQTQLEHTNIQLFGARQMLGELIWD